MSKQVNHFESHNNQLYTFLAAKKIFFLTTPNKCMLFELNGKKGLSLTTRNTVVLTKSNGMLLFPKNR